MTSERDVRDRLAEALWRAGGELPAALSWPDDASLEGEERNRRLALRLVRALPAVGLLPPEIAPVVVAGCGCVYCDLGLPAYVRADGSVVHESKGTAVHHCTRPATISTDPQDDGGRG